MDIDMITQPAVESNQAESANPEHERVRAFTQGLREFADFLDEHPEIGLPGHLSPRFFGEPVNGAPLIRYFPEGREGLAQFARAAGKVSKHADTTFFVVQADRTFGNIVLQAAEYREAVCKRVEKTRTVEREVPTGEVVVKQIEEPVTEKREVEETYFEWECPDSLLAEVVE